MTTNILLINEFPDMKSDAKTGKNHLIVTFGKKNARWGYLLILIAAFASSLALIQTISSDLSFFNEYFFIAGNVILFFYGLSAFFNLFKNYDERELVHSNLKTIYLQIFYGLFIILALNLFFI